MLKYALNNEYIDNNLYIFKKYINCKGGLYSVQKEEGPSFSSVASAPPPEGPHGVIQQREKVGCLVHDPVMKSSANTRGTK